MLSYADIVYLIKVFLYVQVVKSIEQKTLIRKFSF